MSTSIMSNQEMPSTTDLVLNQQAMEQMDKLATLMSQAKVTVPVHLQGSPSDCMAIVMQSAQWKMNPFIVAQKTHLVSGILGYEAQLVNAVISSSTAIQGRFHYEYGGDWTIEGEGVGVVTNAQKGVNVNIGTTISPNCWVRVGATLAGETEIQWGEPLYPSTITTKNSPLWKTNPKQQAAYLATKYWARLYAPAVIMGVYSTDELQPVTSKEREINPGLQPEKAATSTLNQILNTPSTNEIPVSEPLVVEPELNQYEGLKTAIENSPTIAELTNAGAQVAEAVKAHKISAEERKELGKLFTRIHRDLHQG
ncbi:RecT family recombinase [Shewanella surugensis]|uniref:Recombinase RecT n=1 Tax=Shewanella surugensis TaxID=212020 RepID=A0ABT0LAU6_9GAMM|nr:RecT family recombinase [Shewanella surugensis]MCL1124482.1 recombinase RecT [Shewanella surugensis]